MLDCLLIGSLPLYLALRAAYVAIGSTVHQAGCETLHIFMVNKATVIHTLLFYFIDNNTRDKKTNRPGVFYYIDINGFE